MGLNVVREREWECEWEMLTRKGWNKYQEHT